MTRETVQRFAPVMPSNRLLACAFLAACLCAASASATQIMGLVKGTEMDFSTGTKQVVGAFCLEKHVPGPPEPRTALKPLTGKVRITYTNGRVSDLPLADAFDSGSLVRIEGTGEYSLTVWAEPGVRSIEVLEHAAVCDPAIDFHTPDNAIRLARVDRVLERYDPTRSRRENQERRFHDETLERVTGDGGVTTYARRWAHPDDFASWHLPQPGPQADASLLRTPRGRYVLHDAGAGADQIAALLENVPLREGHRHLSLVLTQPDLDDYGGLLRLLSPQSHVVIQELVIGVAASRVQGADPDLAFTDAFSRLLAEIRHSGLEPVSGFHDFARFRNTGAGEPLELTRVTDLLERAYPHLGRSQERRLPEVYELDIDGIRLRLCRMSQPETLAAGDASRRHNLITWYEHEGYAVLDLGQPDVAQLAEFIATPADAVRAALNECRAAAAGSKVAELEETTRELADRRLQLERELHALRQQEGMKRDILRHKKELLADVTDAHKEAEQSLRRERASLPDIRKTVAIWEQRLAAIRKAWQEHSYPADMTDGYALAFPGMRADVVKWPHHAWCPATDQERRIMKACLRVVRPSQVIVNLPRSMTPAQRARYADIQAIIREAVAEDRAASGNLNIEIITTADTGLKLHVRHDAHDGPLTPQRGPAPRIGSA
jgi:hypothetical protein